MSKNNQTNRAAKKHAKALKRKKLLASSRSTGGDHRPRPAPATRAPRPSGGLDAEVESLLDHAEETVYFAESRQSGIEALFSADVLLAAEGGEERFTRHGYLDNLAAIWLRASPSHLEGPLLSQAAAAITRVLSTAIDPELHAQLRVVHDDMLFLLGRGDEVLDRVLGRATHAEADLGYAVDVVLDCKGSTDANILRVLTTCRSLAAQVTDADEAEFVNEQVGYLEAALEKRRAKGD